MASLQLPIMSVQSATATQQQRFLHALHYIAPALVLGYFLITTTISVCTLQNRKASATGSRKVILPLVSLVVTLFLVESCMLSIDTVLNHARQSSTDSNVSINPHEFGSQPPASFPLTTC